MIKTIQRRCRWVAPLGNRTAALSFALMCCVGAAAAQQTPPQAEESVPADIPLPERNPKKLEPPAPPHPRDIEAPTWTAQEIQDATDRCEMLLADTGAIYKSLKPIREGVCGTAAPIELSLIGKIMPVKISPPARVTCGLAATLNAWADTVLQPYAQKYLKTDITDIRNVASYVCRNRYNAPGKRISEHARANALDMASFKTADGRSITVLDSWAVPPKEHPDVEQAPSTDAAKADVPAGSATQSETADKPSTPEPPEPVEPKPYAPESAFLYEIHNGACSLFGTVLGPLANESHKDHFHYDLAERKHTNFCE